MARMPRGIELDKDGLYHIRVQVAGPEGYYPLQEKKNAQELTRIVRHYTQLYFCRVPAYDPMGDHFHLSCRFEAYRELSPEELLEHAERFYPDAYRPYLAWGPREWARFNRRLFNVSELMRNINQAFARFFNRRHHRKGPFWASRFRSTESNNLLETVLYVDLNPVRGHLTDRPEKWPCSSPWMRKNGQDGWLMPLEELLETSDRDEADKLYWVYLYWRGTRPSKDGDGVIPVGMAEQMEREKVGRGCYLKRRELLSRGHRVGTREEIAAELVKCREKGIYKRRINPIPVGVANLHALREVRSTPEI